MKANVTFELDQASGRERTRVALYDDAGQLLGELPCVTGCSVAYQHDGVTRVTLSLLVDRKRLTFGTPKADGATS
jgi:hypothetical protein